jgi:hypothetical protein
MKLKTENIQRLFTKVKLLTSLSCLLFATMANAEITVAMYAGKSFVDNGDLTLNQGNTNLHYSNVSWSDQSFHSPILYGGRIGYWFDSAPNWGLSIDYTHIKNLLNVNQTTQVNGVLNGVPHNAVEPISNTIQEFGMTHGVNAITFNGMYRWFPAGERNESLLGRMQLYTGLGAGFIVPFVLASINGSNTFQYQAGAGPAVNGMLGINYDIYSFMSAFVEYKLTYVDAQPNLNGGGSISTQTVNNQLLFGLSARFDP